MQSDKPTPIGRWLKAMREVSGLSLGDVSEASGIKISDLVKMESGEIYPNFNHFKALCNAIKASPTRYFNDMHPEPTITGKHLLPLR